MKSYTIEVGQEDYVESVAVDQLCVGLSKECTGKYFNEFATFDIETTSMQDYGFMYLFAFTVNDRTIIGRRWEEYLEVIEAILQYFKPNNKKRFVIYVHNLSFEFQFIRNFHNWIKVFSVKERLPIRALTDQYIEFRCSWKLTNMSLEKFLQNTPGVRKKAVGKLDYTICRTPETLLSNDELYYMYCDVKGLHEGIEHLLLEDTLDSIPYTSTGYIRRECRKYVLSNKNNWELINYTAVDTYLYTLLHTMRRGGDCHATVLKSNEIIEDVDSWDIKSSYPYALVCERYPVTPFLECRPSTELNPDRAYILWVEFTSIKLKDMRMIGYIPRAKVTQIRGFINDNGRVMKADYLSMLMTDIDFNIIQERYTYESCTILQSFSAGYGYLPDELRQYIIDLFIKKCELEDGDPYLYAKFKNKINAVFGMCMTDICQQDILYTEDGEWERSAIDVEEKLSKYYDSRTSFLAYQWGIWTTAIARKRLNEPYKQIYKYAIYSDTDSWKIERGYAKSVFDNINQQVIEHAESMRIKPYAIRKDGTKEYLGIWEFENTYDEFKTLGAKKYAWRIGDEISVTVSGLSKKKGSEYIKQLGGLEYFTDNTVFDTEHSGRTCAAYDDTTEIRQITIDGCTFTTSSSISIHETTYTLGRSSEYEALVDEIKFYGIKNIY